MAGGGPRRSDCKAAFFKGVQGARTLAGLARTVSRRLFRLFHPGAAAPELPVFLRRMTWADLGEEDGIERLIWGITGRRPAR